MQAEHYTVHAMESRLFRFDDAKPLLGRGPAPFPQENDKRPNRFTVSPCSPKTTGKSLRWNPWDLPRCFGEPDGSGRAGVDDGFSICGTVMLARVFRADWNGEVVSSGGCRW